MEELHLCVASLLVALGQRPLQALGPAISTAHVLQPGLGSMALVCKLQLQRPACFVHVAQASNQLCSLRCRFRRLHTRQLRLPLALACLRDGFCGTSFSCPDTCALVFDGTSNVGIHRSNGFLVPGVCCGSCCLFRMLELISKLVALLVSRLDFLIFGANRLLKETLASDTMEHQLACRWLSSA